MLSVVVQILSGFSLFVVLFFVRFVELSASFSSCFQFAYVEHGVGSHGRGESVRDKLDEEVADKLGAGNNKSLNPLLPCETLSVHFENLSSIHGQDDLKDNNEDPDSDENPVVTDSRENIEFVVNFS